MTRNISRWRLTEFLCGRERNWRGSGIGFVLFFIVAYVIYGSQPKVGASAETLVSFYDGDRTRILIAAVIFGLGVVSAPLRSEPRNGEHV